MAKRTQEHASGLFTHADYKALMEARRRLNEQIQVHDKAQACGINCDALRGIRDNIDKQLEAIQHHFMTPPPT
jgi:hypothetical protein